MLRPECHGIGDRTGNRRKEPEPVARQGRKGRSQGHNQERPNKTRYPPSCQVHCARVAPGRVSLRLFEGCRGLCVQQPVLSCRSSRLSAGDAVRLHPRSRHWRQGMDHGEAYRGREADRQRSRGFPAEAGRLDIRCSILHWAHPIVRPYVRKCPTPMVAMASIPGMA